MAKEEDKKEVSIEIPTDLDITSVPETSDASSESSPILTDQQSDQFEKALSDEKEFGDQTLKAGALGLARGATLGISDQALVKSGLVDAETLRELEARNKAASLAGEVVGTVAPLIGTGGTGLAAKGAATAGAAVKGASAAGQIVERISAKALEKAIAQTGNKKFAQEVIKKALPKTAGSAVEGAFYGTGQLLSEDALGKAEFNAENLMASAGAGAAIGGLTGSVFGAGEALVPVVSKVKDKVTGKISETSKKFFDREDAALELVGMTPAKMTAFKKNNPQLTAELPDWLAEKAQLGKFTGTESLRKNIDNIQLNSGKKIGNILREIDDIAKTEPAILPTKREVYTRVANKIDDDVIAPFAETPGFESVLRKATKIRNDYRKLANSDNPVNASELQSLRIKMDKLSGLHKEIGKKTLAEEAAYSARVALREEIDSLASRASSVSNSEKFRNLAEDLKGANRDYEITTQILPGVEKKVDKDKIFSLTDILLGGGALGSGAESLLGIAAVKKFINSDFRRRLTILSDIEKQNRKVESRLVGGVKNFFKEKSFPVKSASTKILMSSALSDSYESKTKRKKPESKEKAFENLSNNLNRLTSDPDFFADRVARNTTRLRMAAPNTAEAVQASTMRGISFLQSKLPKRPAQAILQLGPKKSFMPSELEMAKFERYLQVVENPISIMDDLEQGTLTREHIEAISAVYPELYQELREKVFEKVVEEGDKLDYSKRVQLGILMDLPTDPSLVPTVIMSLQDNFQEQVEGEGEPEEKSFVSPTVGGVKDIEKASRSASPSEMVINRRVTE